MTGALVAAPAWKYALSWYTSSRNLKRVVRGKERSPYLSTLRIAFFVNHVRHNVPQTPSPSNGKLFGKKKGTGTWLLSNISGRILNAGSMMAIEKRRQILISD
jgi:hypothetical protein